MVSNRVAFFPSILLISALCASQVFALPDCIGESLNLFDNPPFVDYIRGAFNDGDLQELRAYFDAYENNELSEAMSHLRNIKIRKVLRRSINRTITAIPDIIKGHGYPVEKHNVETKDGYILSFYRIPGSPNSATALKNKIPVLIMHGLFESSNAWIVQGPSKSLAFLLADAGYDVWLNNARGTHDSQQHVSLSPSGHQKKDFWSFSWHEIGVYDLPAVIDYILEKTKKKKLHYIGHSQGTTAFFVMASELPEYNNKIILNSALAPVTYLQNITSPLHRTFNYFYEAIKVALNWFGIYDIDVNNRLLVNLSEMACRKAVQSATSRICRGILYMMASNQLNCSAIPLILEHAPNSVSVRQLFHFIQLMRSNEFRKFDYEDAKKNEEAYGQEEPPAYNLTQVTAPTFFHYSFGDETATVQNAMTLKSRLPNMIGEAVVPRDDFSHVDFVYSSYVRKLLNEKIIHVMKKMDEKRKSGGDTLQDIL